MFGSIGSKGTIGIVVFLVLVSGITGCDSERKKETKRLPSMARQVHINDATRKELEHLVREKILFAHHSVGGNIIEGLQQLSQQVNIPLRIIAVAQPSIDEKNGFYHFSPGKNSQPESKVDGFVQFLQSEHNQQFDIAFMKFCFVDFTPGRDVERIFEYYTKNIQNLQRVYPYTIFIHCTVPLTVRSVSLKDRLKRLFGLQVWGDTANRIREQYNSLLRNSFPQNRIFDLARVESTQPDGGRMEDLHQGGETYSLLPAYTDDGGHLNKQGQYVVAVSLVHFLSHLTDN